MIISLIVFTSQMTSAREMVAFEARRRRRRGEK